MHKPRELLTYIESGMGHIMSMQAILDGLKSEENIDKIELIESYIMNEGSKETEQFEKFLSSCTKKTNKHKAFGIGIFWFLEIAGKAHFMRLIHRTIFKKFTAATIESMRKYQPDVIISTHYFITFAALELKKKYMPNLVVITYNPDNNVHVWWDNRSDLFINNNLKACNEAIRKRKFKFETIRKVFFTARSEISNAKGTKEEYRKKYHLPQNHFTITIADGAYAQAKAKSVCNALMKLSFPVTLIILAGKNEKVLKYFEKKKKNVPSHIHLVPLGFTPLAYEYYGASDIFITKAGPNAVLDSLFMGTPVIIDYYAHNIEKATEKLFVQTLKCGITCHRVSHMAQVVTHLYEHPEILEELRQNIRKNVNRDNNGAKQIADIIMSELRERKFID